MGHSDGPRPPALPELANLASDLLDACRQPPLTAALALLALLLVVRLLVLLAAGSG